MTNKSESIEQALNEVLTQSLAAYILLRSKEPVYEVMQDLIEIELKAAAIVDTHFSQKPDTKCPLNFETILASIFSYLKTTHSQFEKN